MNAEIRPIKTAAETALAAEFADREGARCRARRVAALREAAFKRFETAGLPHRRVEEWKYTDLRALMRDAKPLAAPPDAAAKARAKDAGAAFASIEAPPHRVRRRRVRAGTLRSRRPRAGLTIRSMAQALASNDAAVAAHARQGRADRRRRGGAQHRLHG